MEWIVDESVLAPPRDGYCALDLETTGLSPQRDRIIEIGAVAFGTLGTAQVKRWSSLVNPGVPVSPGAQGVHGIRTSDLEGEPRLDEILEDFLQFLSGKILVGHKLSFDLAFIHKALGRRGRPPLENRAVDTLPLVRRAFPRRRSYSLEKITQELGIPGSRYHRALDDAELCRQLFLRIWREKNPGGQGGLFDS